MIINTIPSITRLISGAGLFQGVIQLTLLCTLVQPESASAEIYIYRGPNGERMITDRPPHNTRDYRLETRRDTLTNVGHLLANRPEPIDLRVGRSQKSNRYQQYIQQASRRFHVERALIEAIIEVESGFDPNAVSKKGAAGLMQLMLPTARQYHVSNRFNPRQNINAGTEHLRRLIDRFNGQLTLAVAAYNAGGGAVERHRGIPPYPETRRYVQKVMGALERTRRESGGINLQAAR